MHPEIERQMAAERVRELRRAGAVARLKAATPARAAQQRDVLIRDARPSDHLAIQALAVLDAAELPLGRVLVAEVDGSIVAALPLGGASAFSDPFRHTSDLVALLEARAKQIGSEPVRRSHPRFAWLARFV